MTDALTDLPLTSGEGPLEPQDRRSGARLGEMLAPRRIGGVYAFLALIVGFGIFADSFFTTDTALSILSEQSVTMIVALGLTIPLAAGVFDLSIAGSIGLGAIVGSRLMVDFGVPIPVAILVTLLVCVPIGMLNGLLVVRARIHPLIATLGVGSILTGLVYWSSGNRNVLGLPDGFRSIASTRLGVIPLPVVYVALIVLALWYVLEWTPIGRRLYATGAGLEVAKLAGIRTERIVIGSFVWASAFCLLAGIIVTARLGTGSPTVGPTYLLPAFAAAFLGATQFKPGRFNVWGTVLAVLFLATGVKGLVLMGAEFWVRDLFNGTALVVAVGISSMQRSAR